MMKVEELKQKIEKRERGKKQLDRIEGLYKALLKDIEEYGDGCEVSYVTFHCPVESLSINLEDMPAVPAQSLAKAIGESIATMHRYIEGIDDDLKGIVEFED